MPKSDYNVTIGLEVHAELKTKTKLFCNSKNDPGEKSPNTNICPICMAHPGVLPVLNKEAVKHVLKIGTAVGGKIADFTEFDRKNYFYPDIPKGYQISQYKYPLVTGGELGGVAITRVHLEEDTARSTHDRGEYTLIDFNRSGIPLMELVTEPVIHDALTAGKFARELQLLLRTLSVSDANMEKGEMRVEANISVSKDSSFGTKVEVKNLNSFKSVERAIAYEIGRQTDVLESGGKIAQETRGWDENKGETFSQREKESSHDYRYFPDPDIPKLKISEITEFSKENILKEMPELPWVKRERMIKEYGIKPEQVEIFIQNKELGFVFEEGVRGEDMEIIKLAANLVTSTVLNSLPSTPSYLGDLVKMQVSGSISSTSAKIILPIMFKENRHPKEIAGDMGLLQVSDVVALGEIVDKIIKDNEKIVLEFKNGKESSLQYLIGQGMKEAKGSANPQVLKELFLQKLK